MSTRQKEMITDIDGGVNEMENFFFLRGQSSKKVNSFRNTVKSLKKTIEIVREDAFMECLCGTALRSTSRSKSFWA